MNAMFAYIDQLFSIVRPRRLLYMAIDGVAPRAKMNQQRSRRFRSAREARQKREIEEGVQADLLKMGRITPDQYHTVLEDKPHFDNNSITPGTEFMDLVAKALQYYAVERLSTDPGWRGVQVILSDASVPGEGEHKIMELIRYQRQLPTYEPNTQHVICGLDADLIMLALATHEPHFTILREFVSVDGKRGQSGPPPTDTVVPTGDPSQPGNDPPPRQAPYQFLRINVLREYLSADLYVEGLPFAWDLERALDDYVFLCFFVGNDFLPHMPTLEIREGAIELLIELWKKVLPKMGGFATEDGEVNFQRAELILSELGDLENEILSRRRHREMRSRARFLEQAARDRRLESEALLARQERQRSGDLTEVSVVSTPSESTNSAVPLAPAPSVADNKAAALALRQQLLGLLPPVVEETTWQVKRERPMADNSLDDAPKAKRAKPNDSALPSAGVTEAVAPTAAPLSATTEIPPQPLTDLPSSADSVTALENEDGFKPKRRTVLIEDQDVRPLTSSNSTDALPVVAEEDSDTVKLGEEGWKERYYQSKFGAKLDNPEDAAFFRRLISAYIHGLQWVLRYYYQGCCSWTWYYPFHYTPFAGELKDLASIAVSFEMGVPFTPYEQLMGVLPAASDRCLPEPYRWLMSDPTSPIIEFYPPDFEIDLNGKRFEWQGVALLPFIDQDKLLDAIRPVAEKVSPLERLRNTPGQDLYFVRFDHPASAAIVEANEFGDAGLTPVPLDPATTSSFAGLVSCWAYSVQNLVVDQPYIPRQYPGVGLDPMSSLPTIPKNKATGAKYFLPLLPPGTRFRARLLSNVSMPKQELTSWDFNRRRQFQHFGSNTSGTRILDFVLNANRGGRGGFADRGSRSNSFNDRGTFPQRGSERGGNTDRGRHGDRGGYAYRGGYVDHGRGDRRGWREPHESSYRPHPYANRPFDDRREHDRRGPERDDRRPYREYDRPRFDDRRQQGREGDYRGDRRYDNRRGADRHDRHDRYDGRQDPQPAPPNDTRPYAGLTPPLSFPPPPPAGAHPLAQLPPAIAAALLLHQHGGPIPTLNVHPTSPAWPPQ